MRVAVIGAGAWGTALALQAARAGGPVSLLARDPARAAAVARSRVNERHLPGAVLPPSVLVTAEPGVALSGAEVALLAVPVQFLAGVLGTLPALPPCVLVSKGVEAATGRLPLEILAAARPGLSGLVLGGPNFAHEVAAGLPAAAVVAGEEAAARSALVARLGTSALRLYEGADPVGVQLGGAAKNVVAIGAGAVIGAGLGENARAALLTRALAELARLVLALGGRAETVSGLSGLGDLVLTCAGAGSRNFSLGHALGRGERAEAVLAGRVGVTEGVATAPALVARAAAHGVEMPVCGAVAALLAGRLGVREAVSALMARPPRAE